MNVRDAPAKAKDRSASAEEKVPEKANTADRQITEGEVSLHDSHEDCWIIVDECVYDITTFMNSHPGGDTVLLELAGRDATLTFQATGHGSAMLEVLQRYRVGCLSRLPAHQTITN